MSNDTNSKPSVFAAPGAFSMNWESRDISMTRLYLAHMRLGTTKDAVLHQGHNLPEPYPQNTVFSAVILLGLGVLSLLRLNTSMSGFFRFRFF
jgi:hypothetical protein